MNAGTGTGPFRSAYAAALLDYLLEPSEATLRVAYELAREAVSRSFNVLELADAHQQALHVGAPRRLRRSGGAGHRAGGR